MFGRKGLSEKRMDYFIGEVRHLSYLIRLLSGHRSHLNQIGELCPPIILAVTVWLTMTATFPTSVESGCHGADSL